MAVEEFSGAFFFEGGTCSTGNFLVAWPREVDELVDEGNCLVEYMNGISMENMHPQIKGALSYFAFSGLDKAGGALVEAACRYYGTFCVMEETENMNCAVEAKKAMRRRQARYDAAFAASGNIIPVAGRQASKPSDRVVPGPDGLWVNTEAISRMSRTVAANDITEELSLGAHENNDSVDHFGLTGADEDDDEDEEDIDDDDADEDEDGDDDEMDVGSDRGQLKNPDGGGNDKTDGDAAEEEDDGTVDGLYS